MKDNILSYKLLLFDTVQLPVSILLYYRLNSGRM